MNIRKLSVDEKAPVNLLLTADPSIDHVNDYVGRGQCFLAETNDIIAGVCVLLPTRPGIAELVNIAVEEAMQGQGIGKLLVQKAIELARRQGFKKLEVGTGNSSIGQLAFYQKCGFRIIGIDMDFFIHYEEEIIENGIKCKDMIRLSQDL